MNTTFDSIVLNREALPIEVPAGYTGPLTFPGNGKTVWWTGRVAIGLRHQRPRHEGITQSSLWIQDLLSHQSRLAA
ncbi:MAG: hypothetical protein ABW200_06825 [Hyphomicrobiaceae bacterium]